MLSPPAPPFRLPADWKLWVWRRSLCQNSSPVFWFRAFSCWPVFCSCTTSTNPSWGSLIWNTWPPYAGTGDQAALRKKAIPLVNLILKNHQIGKFSIRRERGCLHCVMFSNFPSGRRRFHGPSCQTRTKKKRSCLVTMRILRTKVALQAHKSKQPVTSPTTRVDSVFTYLFHI